MDPVSTQRLAQLHPVLQHQVTQLDQVLAAKGIECRIVQGLRTLAEQDAIYAQGRTTPGKIVTNARGGQSWHNYGVAFDFIPGIRGAASWQPNWNPGHPDYATMIAEGCSLGLISGAHWKHLPDYPHFQLACLPVSPTQEHEQFLREEGVAAFWQKFVSTNPPEESHATCLS